MSNSPDYSAKLIIMVSEGMNWNWSIMPWLKLYVYASDFPKILSTTDICSLVNKPVNVPKNLLDYNSTTGGHYSGTPAAGLLPGSIRPSYSTPT